MNTENAGFALKKLDDAWLENKLWSLACLMKEGGDVSPDLWSEVAVEVATLAAAAVVNSVDELEAARAYKARQGNAAFKSVVSVKRLQ